MQMMVVSEGRDVPWLAGAQKRLFLPSLLALEILSDIHEAGSVHAQ